MGTRVAIHGATGRLGQLIVKEAGPNYAGAISATGDIPMSDVVVDVTSPEGLSKLIERLSGQPLLIGTTGALPMEVLTAYSTTAPVAIVPNFSAGVPLLLQLIQKSL